MKAKIIFDKILEKVDLEQEKKNQYYDKLQAAGNVDLPDDFEEILNKFETLHSEKSAIANRNIADKVFDKRKKDIDKATGARLSELGFSQSEIESILSLPIEDRASKIASLTDDKAKSKYNISESERIKQESDAARREKERADRLQQQMLESEKRLKQDYEKERVNIRLQYYVNNLPKSDVIPSDKANILVINELQQMLARDNAKIIEVAGALKVVNADDEAQDVYDERNMRINLEEYVKRAIREVKLEPKEQKQQQKQATVVLGQQQTQNRVNDYLQKFATTKTTGSYF